MANNFFNKTNRNVSADHTLPTYVYTVPLSKKTIVIELDVANRSTSSQTISVMIEDFSAKGANKVSTVASIGASNTITTATHGFTTGDVIRLTNSTNGGASDIRVGGTEPPTAGNTTAYGTQPIDPVYYAIVVNATTFKLASSHTNATAGTNLAVTGSHNADDIWNSLAFTYIVRDAPLPIGGALKVIAGQKLVMEANANGGDSMIIQTSSASSVDAIASILEDVS